MSSAIRLTCLVALATGVVPAAMPTARERAFQFICTVRVKDIPASVKTVELWLPVPHDTPYQRIANLRVESPYAWTQATGRDGNAILHLDAPRPASGWFDVSMRFDAVRIEHLQPLDASASFEPVPDDELSRWLTPDRLVPLDRQIRAWAQEVVDTAHAATDLEKARAIYNHVVATVKYDKTGKGWGRGDIYYACSERRGNCTDFHAVFIGYARAVGIPARFSIGFPLPAERGAGKISGYHCWAEFYAKGIGWVPIDASEAAKNPAKREYFFGAHDENRVEFTRGRDLVLIPRQHGDALNYFVYPYAEADGAPYAALETTYSYLDMPAPATDTARR